MIAHLPRVNALLNLSSACLLAGGYYFIRKNMVEFHRACMVAAFVVSSAFLVSYLTYHAHVGNVRYTGQGLIRTVYFSILISHTLLAVVILPLVLRTLYLAVKCRYEEHRRWAHWALPLWFYVSVTGVVIYEMLY
jgi:putative membrane protein